MATLSENVSFETLFTERNRRCQENQGDRDVEARPKDPSCCKDSTYVHEDRLKLQNLELTAKVAMLEAEVSKLRHQASMHESHICTHPASSSLVSAGTQIDSTLLTDATKKGEEILQDDDDSLEEWFKEQEEFQRTLFKPSFIQVQEIEWEDSRDEEEEVPE
ncbi:hypothetical protein L1987_42608 [Smallanthus sonchifolius]|uniref:Uncharacterized protein n=1 Tax=Smallanthus sonchifolius TaxID=185202 RepID=A0ACB9GJ26_9ASTR|nr:hypothetical protein L1987_42608 [Smallanthus sonchifolius]